jgi:uncharacterized protein YwbE
MSDVGRVARIVLLQHTKTGKIYQITIEKYATKWPQDIPNGRKIDQNDHKIDQNFPLQVYPKFTQIRVLSFRTCHLATLAL